MAAMSASPQRDVASVADAGHRGLWRSGRSPEWRKGGHETHLTLKTHGWWVISLNILMIISGKNRHSK